MKNSIENQNSHRTHTSTEENQIDNSARFLTHSSRSALSTFLSGIEQNLISQGENPSMISCMPLIEQVTIDQLPDMRHFVNSSESSHVLLENQIMKAILIYWPPGKIGRMHAHPQGGGVYKLLFGSLEELRFSMDSSPKLLSTSIYHPGSMAYIDDSIAQHAVGNPFSVPAISLHIYTRSASIAAAA